MRYVIGLIGIIALAGLASTCGVAAPSTSETGINVNTMPTDATHTYFPIDPNSPHEGIGCTECHGNGSSFQEFACTACHTHDLDVVQPIHQQANVVGFVYQDAACYSCHPWPEVGNPTGPAPTTAAPP